MEAYTIETLHISGKKESRRSKQQQQQQQTEREKRKKAQKGEERDTFGVILSSKKIKTEAFGF